MTTAKSPADIASAPKFHVPAVNVTYDGFEWPDRKALNAALAQSAANAAYPEIFRQGYSFGWEQAIRWLASAGYLDLPRMIQDDVARVEP